MGKRTAALVGIVGALVATIACTTSFFVWQSLGHNKGQNLCGVCAPGGIQKEFHQQLADAQQSAQLQELLRARRILNDNAAAIVRMHTGVARNLAAFNAALQKEFGVQAGHNYNYEQKQKVLYEVFRAENSPSRTGRDHSAVTAANAPSPRVERRVHRTIESDEQEKRLVGLTAQKAQLTRYAVFFQQIHRAQLARLQAVNQKLIVDFDIQPDRHYTYDPDAKAVYRVCLQQPTETSRSTALK